MSTPLQRLVVLSDLHIAPATALGNFDAGNELACFTAKQAASAEPGHVLMLAGDVIDFLLVENRSHSLHLATARSFATEVMHRLVLDKEWMRPWLEALKTWITNGGQVVLLPGNHDLEWYHPDTDQVWHELLGGRPAVTTGFTTWRGVGPWRTSVGPWEVIVGHGHRGDALNDCDPALIHQALLHGKKEIHLPPGSLFVLETLHAFKRAMDPLTGHRRFPFLDALKPEPAVLAFLLALDKKLFFKHLPAGLALTLQKLRHSLLRRIQGGPTLGSTTESAGNEATVEEMLAEVIATGIQGGFTPSAAIIDVELESLSRPDVETGQDTLSRSGGRLRQWLVRGWLRQQSGAINAFFDPIKPSEFDQAVMAEWLPPSLDEHHRRIVVCGHSHAARLHTRPDRPHHYLNTGTWSRLLDVSGRADSDPAIQALLDDLFANRVKLESKLTWGEITQEGPHLNTF